MRAAAYTPEATRQALAQIAADPRVRYADPDLLLWAKSRTPDDPLFPQQWNLAQIHATTGWAYGTGSASVVVAVLDTGVLPHPDLAPRLLPGYDFILDPTFAQDGDGRDSDPSDPGTLLHGTHVAGIIAASANNQHGIAGVDWACRLLPVRVLAPSPDGKLGGRVSDLIPALRWAAGQEVPGVTPTAHPAQVINLSLGSTAASGRP